MRLHLEKKVGAAFTLAVTVLIGLGVYSFLNNRALLKSNATVSHANEVLYHLEQVLSSAMNIETGSRGFTISKDTTYLQPYLLGVREIDTHVQSLITLTEGHPLQKQHVEILRDLVKRKIEYSESIINAVKQNTPLPVLDKKIMDEIRAWVNKLQTEQEKLRQDQTKTSENNVTDFYRAFILLISIATLILIIVFVMTYLNLRARTVAEERLRTVSEQIKDLYDNAPCGYHSLDGQGIFLEMNQTLLTWLQYTREEVIGVKKFVDIVPAANVGQFDESFRAFKKEGHVSNREFSFVRKDGTTFPVILNSSAVRDDHQNFIRSRTTVFDNTDRKAAEIKVNLLNKELEAFTYSVSHDLRAPLRSIHGYSQILLEDHAEKLGDDGRRVLTIVMNNARKMGKLIDDLLDFSRVGRKELARTRLNMNELVYSVTTEVLTTNRDKSEVDIVVNPLEPSLADQSLIRQVWINLLSNAVKYSSKSKTPSIEVGSTSNAEEVVYHVKDNGVGFDMNYSNKLFQVFQRLHKETDFEGTGVGLALVHRIVTRHGGKVWAQAELNHGATFYFSIPHAQNLPRKTS